MQRAKKSLGQNFLVQPGIAKKIAASLSLEGYDQLLEVGPGRGILTEFLRELDFPLTAVEIDRALYEDIVQQGTDDKFRIVHGDFLKQDLRELMGDKPFGLVGNYPYMISSQIVFKMLDYVPYIPEMVGMFQKEMAQRIVAVPGTKDYGILSVLTQLKYDGRILFTVGSKNFFPPPKVESAVIRLRRKVNPATNYDAKQLKTLVKLSFGKRRKMLRNSLKGIFPDENLASEEIFTQRPDKITPEGFVELTRYLEELRKGEKDS